MTMEWSCLPSRTVYGAYHVTSGNFFGGAGGWNGQLIYSYSFATGVSGSGTGFTPSGLVNTQAVTAPSTPGTYNYSLTCIGGTNAMTVPVTVQPGPTITITGNASNPTTAVVGLPITITATFAPYAGDALAKTAINDNLGNLWCGTGNTCTTAMWTATPMGTKTYTFTPSAVGTYTFTPSVQTTNFPAWNNYSKSLTITVVAQCPNGSGPSGSCTSCNSGFVLNGTAPSNSCVAQCPNGSGPAGACTACNVGYTINGGNCVAQCPNGSGPAGACTSCNSPYVLSGGSCVYAPPVSIGAFSANPVRVRKNITTSVTFSYTVLNPVSTCTISGPSGFTPISITPVNGVAGTQTANVTLSQTSAFTLTCGSVAVQTSIGLIPNVQEI
jgi:hypothetical protein